MITKKIFSTLFFTVFVCKETLNIYLILKNPALVSAITMIYFRNFIGNADLS
ncbi:MAG: hypothetical protein LBD07_05620 [Spirochaetaceae bacterium]|jgi:hypothetical protein|nr:hypothetical protein [Spirochaetaceae bacterium]